MNDLAQNNKFIKICATLCCLLVCIFGCSTVSVVQPLSPKEQVSEPIQETVTVSTSEDNSPQAMEKPTLQQVNISPPVQENKAIPTISSISQSSGTNRERTITLKGSGFDNGTSVEIYTTSGKYIGTGILSGKPRSNQLTVKLMKDLSPGKYTVKVKTPTGQFSNTTTLTIAKPSKKPVPAVPQQSQCIGHFSKEPRVIYLGGGDVVKLFDRYLAENSGIKTDTGNFDLKIKFYEKGKTSPETVWFDNETLDFLKKQFFESWEDFIDKLKKRLNGRVAEYSATLADDAMRENADYFQCP